MRRTLVCNRTSDGDRTPFGPCLSAVTAGTPMCMDGNGSGLIVLIIAAVVVAFAIGATGFILEARRKHADPLRYHVGSEGDSEYSSEYSRDGNW